MRVEDEVGGIMRKEVLKKVDKKKTGIIKRGPRVGVSVLECKKETRKRRLSGCCCCCSCRESNKTPSSVLTAPLVRFNLFDWPWVWWLIDWFKAWINVYTNAYFFLVGFFMISLFDGGITIAKKRVSRGIPNGSLWPTFGEKALHEVQNKQCVFFLNLNNSFSLMKIDWLRFSEYLHLN